MKPWREHRDPWAEAARLDIAPVCKRLGWTRRKLNAELERVASPEAFIERVRRAVAAGDAPRLLHRDSSRGYTNIPQEAMNGEPEAVPEEVQDQISKDAWRGFSDARRRYNEKRKQKDVCARLQLVQADALTRGVDINSGLRMVERALERMERKVDRCDVAA